MKTILSINISCPNSDEEFEFHISYPLFTKENIKLNLLGVSNGIEYKFEAEHGPEFVFNNLSNASDAAYISIDFGPHDYKDNEDFIAIKEALIRTGWIVRL